MAAYIEKNFLMKLCFPYFSARTGSAVGRMSAGDSVECARCRVALRETRRLVQLSDRCTGGATLRLPHLNYINLAYNDLPTLPGKTRADVGVDTHIFTLSLFTLPKNLALQNCSHLSACSCFHLIADNWNISPNFTFLAQLFRMAFLLLCERPRRVRFVRLCKAH